MILKYIYDILLKYKIVLKAALIRHTSNYMRAIIYKILSCPNIKDIHNYINTYIYSIHTYTLIHTFKETSIAISIKLKFHPNT